MPNYEFRCRACGDTFTVSRPMDQSSQPAACPAGHADTVRLLSFAAVGGGAASATQSGSGNWSSSTSGGCCGGGCCS
ncbi:MAG: FmdB family zinc ribbon protein [Actinomycetales bacterium]